MTFPSLNELVRIAENGVSSAFYGAYSVLRKSVLKVLSRVFSGVVYLLVLLLKKMWKNVFLTSCDVESLKDYGIVYDLPNKPESFARGPVKIKSNDTTVTIEQGTILTTADGVEFEVVADKVLTGGSAGTIVNVIAVEAGESGNLPAETELTFRDGAPENVDETATVGAEGIDGGIRIEVTVNGNTEYWAETVEDYRQRLLVRRRNQPCGGCPTDYKLWAERFAGVSRCVPEKNYPHVGAIRCVLIKYDDTDSVTVGSAIVNEVKDYITSEDRRPITADVDVVSCTQKALDFTIDIYPNNTNVQNDVRNALKMALRSFDPGSTVRASDLTADVRAGSSAEKVTVYDIEGSDYYVLSKENAEMPVIDTITWRTYSA